MSQCAKPGFRCSLPPLWNLPQCEHWLREAIRRTIRSFEHHETERVRRDVGSRTELSHDVTEAFRSSVGGIAECGRNVEAEPASAVVVQRERDHEVPRVHQPVGFAVAQVGAESFSEQVRRARSQSFRRGMLSHAQTSLTPRR